ncbi:MAG: hypothetical protein PWQ79_1408 [Thermococcaceae archaeon]|nr:hypothetical protein [Thermococcaceae archaeon]MDK2914493.1 hypothetical protein [Thermococcaceae archaeon]
MLEGKTRGYRNHPQLERFKNHPEPLRAINAYLYEVWKESQRRGYRFEVGKIEALELEEKIPVTRGQLEYEFQHLLKKLQKRDAERYEALKEEKKIEPNPVFFPVEGGVEKWERRKDLTGASP